MSIYISGIQQLGVGVQDADGAFAFCKQIFGTDARVFDEVSAAPLVQHYTGQQIHRRRVILAANLNGGGAFEIWQYKDRDPVRLAAEIEIGMPGIFAGKIKSFDIEASHHFHLEQDLDVSDLLVNPLKQRHYYLQDEEGNHYNVIDYPIDCFTYIPFAGTSGGVAGAVIGCSDMERSLAFYRDILRYDRVVFDEQGTFEDLQDLPGGQLPLRRVLLEMSTPTRGPFSQLLGRSQIELIQVLGKPKKHIYAGRYSGDPGFFHLCYDIQGLEELRQQHLTTGLTFTVDSLDTYDIGDAGGRFAYLEDPDGTLIQFVETHRLPLMEPGLEMDLRKRDPGKPIPRFILQGLRLSREE